MASTAPVVDDTLVFRTSENLLGVYSVKQRKYASYRSPYTSEGILRLIKAREIVSYKGTRDDLPRLAAHLKLPKGKQLSIRGIHVDLQKVYNRGQRDPGLVPTYKKRFDLLPKFPDTPEGRNRAAIAMTFRLWQLWKSGTV